MKILWISHFLLYPETGYGALQRSRNLLKELSKQHEIYLLSFYRDIDHLIAPNLKTIKNDLRKFCKEVILLPHSVKIRNITKGFFILKSLITHIPFSVYLYRNKKMLHEVINIIKKYNIDLLHADTLGLVDDIVENIKIIKVLNHHNIESDMMFRRAKNEKSLIKKIFLCHEAWKLRGYENRMCKKYDLNLVVSELDELRLKTRIANIRTDIIENGVDCKYFNYHPRNNGQRELIFTGALDWYANVDGLIFFCQHVWPSLSKQHKDIRLRIIGKNPLPKLRAVIKACNISLMDYVQDVRMFVKNATIFICPIRDGGGTKLKILDALAQGIPVISTTIGCEGLAIKDKEHVLLADTVEEFTEKISLLFSDISLRNKLSKNGRKFVENHYSFSIIGRKLSTLYEKLKQ